MGGTTGFGDFSPMIRARQSISLISMSNHLRNEAGKHAALINQLKPDAKLEESLGHNHTEVIAGAVFGALVAFALLYFTGVPTVG